MVTSTSIAGITASALRFSFGSDGSPSLNYDEEDPMDKLVEERRRLSTVSLEELTDWTASQGPNSENGQVARAEFLRRQIIALEDTAQFTRRGALAMFITTGILAISAIGAAYFVFRIRRRGGRNRLGQEGGQNRPRLQGREGN
jgi:hypothetical protein